MDIKETLKILCEADGIYGFKSAAADKAKEMLSPFCDEVFYASDGSVIGVKKGVNPGGRKIMLDAHIDEIGLMISEIDEKGFLHFTTVGGVDIKTLPSSEVYVFGRKPVKGIIGTKPPHLQVKDESTKAFKCEDLAIDIGFSREEAEKIVRVGDFASVCGEFTKLSEDMYASKSMDNRAGVCAVLNTAEMLFSEKLDADIYYVFSTGEEFDMSGATISANIIEPDIAIVVDVTHGVTFDNTDHAYVCGGGTSYSVGPNISKKLVNVIKQAAVNKNINIYPEVDGGSSGTNAWAIQVSRTGVATAVLSIPLRYMHTRVETLDINDIKTTSELLCEVCRLSLKL